MHLFLIGDRQAGKSTIIDKVLAAHPLPAQGFRTGFAEGGHGEGKVLRLYPVIQSKIDVRGIVVARFAGNRPVADAEAFNTFGTALLHNVRAGWIVMDECGRLERDAMRFRAQVLKTLDGDIPVLGVLGRDAGVFAQEILGHKKTEAMTVTRENRDALPAQILAGFAAHYGFGIPMS